MEYDGVWVGAGDNHATIRTCFATFTGKVCFLIENVNPNILSNQT